MKDRARRFGDGVNGLYAPRRLPVSFRCTRTIYRPAAHRLLFLSPLAHEREIDQFGTPIWSGDDVRGMKEGGSEEGPEPLTEQLGFGLVIEKKIWWG